LLSYHSFRRMSLVSMLHSLTSSSFLFHVPALPSLYTLSLHDALPIFLPVGEGTCDGPTDEAAGSGHNHRHDCPSLFSSAGIRTPVPPPRFALAQERVDPLLRVDGDRIVRHHLRHPLIGLVHSQFPLLVECRLPYGNCSRRDRRDPMGQGLGGVFELVVVDDVGDETEV